MKIVFPALESELDFGQTSRDPRLMYRRLSFGRDGDNASEIDDMMAIWDAGLPKTNSWVLIIFRNVVSAVDPPDTTHRIFTFEHYERIARENGIDYMIESYFDGVPLEHILG